MKLSFIYWKRDILWTIGITALLLLVGFPILTLGAIWPSVILYLALLFRKSNPVKLLGVSRVLAFQTLVFVVYSFIMLIIGANFFTFIFFVSIISFTSLFLVHQVSTNLCNEYNNEKKFNFKPYQNYLIGNAFLSFFLLLVLLGLRF